MPKNNVKTQNLPFVLNVTAIHDRPFSSAFIMPLKRFTLAVNTNRNIRTVVLYSTREGDLDSTLLKAAHAKLRIPKKASPRLRFFQASSGAEIVCSVDGWMRFSDECENDSLVLVSVGEDFIGKVGSGSGSPSTSTSTGRTSEPASVVNLAALSHVEPDAQRQLTTTAKTLPGIIHAVGLPDLHPGNKYPIRAVFVSQGWIHPPLIGGGIGCGMAWYKLSSLDARSIDGKKIAERLVGVEGPWRTATARREWVGWRLEFAG